MSIMKRDKLQKVPPSAGSHPGACICGLNCTVMLSRPEKSHPLNFTHTFISQDDRLTCQKTFFPLLMQCIFCLSWEHLWYHVISGALVSRSDALKPGVQEGLECVPSSMALLLLLLLYLVCICVCVCTDAGQQAYFTH